MFGGSLAALASPAGLATAAIGLVVGGLTKMVNKIVETEKSLRPMVERSRIGAESLQLLAAAAKAAGSEDGLEGVTDTAQELQLQLGEIAMTGKGRALPALQALGLEAGKLQAMEPEAAWRRVVEELQKIPNAADRAVAAEEIYGGSSEKLAGIINLTNQEMEALLEHLEETGDFLSKDQLADAKAYSKQIAELGSSFGKLGTSIGSAIIPILTDLIDKFNDTVAVLKGDFTGIWTSIRKHVETELNQLVTAYNNTIGKIPGVAEIDMFDFATSVGKGETALDDLGGASTDVKTTFETEMPKTVTAVEDAAGKIVQSEKDTSKDVADEQDKRLKATAKFWDDIAKESADYRTKELAADLTQYGATKTEYKLALASLRTMSSEHLTALQAGNDNASDHELAMYIIANKRYAKERRDAAAEALRIEREAQAQEIADLIAHLKAKNEKRQSFFLDQIRWEGIRRQQAADRAEYLAGQDGGGGGGGNRPSSGFGSTGGVPGGSAAARPAPGPRYRADQAQDPITNVFTNPLGDPTSFQTTGGRNNQFFLFEFPGRRSDALAWLASNNKGQVPGAQYGAFVPSSRPMGSLVQVGDNFTDEHITPINTRGSGNSQGGGKRRYVIQFGEETLATLVLNAQNELVDEGRA